MSKSNNTLISGLIDEMSVQTDSLDIQYSSSVSLEEVESILFLFKQALFPGVFNNYVDTNLKQFLATVLYQLHFKLFNNLRVLGVLDSDAEKLTQEILAKLTSLKKLLFKDISAIFNGDPAAKTLEEVVIAYPSFEAIMIYRIAHEFNSLGLFLFARICTGLAHRQTGIDIHPAASIGDHFCIDHGTGIVIGETAIIGNHVKIYQGVTIGALSVNKRLKNIKRHPTIEDHVTIYARTTILGGDTVIGAHSVIGGNVWLTKSIKPYSKIFNKGYDIEYTRSDHTD